MPNFNTEVNSNPDRGMKTEQKPKVLTVSYGDGYEQRTVDGINNLPEQWSLEWKNRPVAETNKIIKFLEDQGGVTSFDWYPVGYSISSTTTSTATKKLIDTSQYFTNRYLNTTVTDSGGTGGVCTASLSADAVASVSVSTGGSGYNSTSLPSISFTGGGGTGASATAVVSSAGVITAITLVAGGSGYTSAPTVVVTPTPTTTTVTAIDSATQLSLAADILASGETYTIYPYKKYTCAKWSVKEDISGYRTITATFNRVFEP
ncbi:MAG: hypothetical protein HOI54_06835 [Candidatus Marinimicrobia bacterium]|jgi:phage-related protein|nr:hypothetical protein [Candidatus Neomarinimicrobiota bacterium]